jgi:hypothetical protein
MIMKKLVLLLMVLGLATGAYAVDLSGVELSIGGVTDGAGNETEIEVLICEEIVIDVHGPAAYDWLGYLFIRDADTIGGEGGEWGDNLGPPYEPMCSGYYYEATGYPLVMDPNAGDGGDIQRAEVAGFGFGYEVNASQSEGDLVGGEQFRALYHCCGPESEYVYIDLYDAADLSGPQDTIIIHQIPEPATLALLGLGGLFLRRRK